MRLALLALSLGLLSLRFLPVLPPLWLSGVALLLLPLCYWRCWRLLVLLLLGAAWACAQAHWALADRLAPAWDGQTLWIEGEISGLPERDAEGVRFELHHPESRHGLLPERIRLSWPDGPVIRSGERWRVAARLKAPYGLVNLHGFDYEAWLLAKGVGATGTVKAGQLLKAAQDTQGWRDRLRNRLLAVDAHGRSGVLAALVVGDGSGLSRQDWQRLQETGTQHLLVISGQHISLMAGLVFAAVAGLARLGLWPRAWPWLPWAAGISLISALSYGWLAGFEVPVQRACAMVAMALLWRLRFRHLGVVLPWLVALTAVLLLNPLASLQLGFWLSFGALGVLMLCFAGRLGTPKPLESLGRAQWAISLGLLPLLLWLELPVSLNAPLANLLAVPLVNILLVPLSLLGTLLLPLSWLGEPLLGIAGWLAQQLFALLEWCTHLPLWMPPALGPVCLGLVGLGTLIILLPAGLPVRSLGFFLYLPLIFPVLDMPPIGQAKIQVLDVGQGLAVAVTTHRHHLLYDTGPRQGDFDMGVRVVVPVLRGQGVQGLDTLILSHEDLDHAGGAESVLRFLPTAQVISGTQGALAKRLGASPCQSGQQWTWDQVQFSLWRWSAAADDNQASCVLMIEAQGERLLLVGDIDSRVEAALLNAGVLLQADWLLLAHHGSRTGSSRPFLEAVRPQMALISRGRHNAFNHPHPSVLERLESLTIPWRDTALSGSLQLDLGAFGPIREARSKRYFWRM